MPDGFDLQIGWHSFNLVKHWGIYMVISTYFNLSFVSDMETTGWSRRRLCAGQLCPLSGQVYIRINIQVCLKIGVPESSMPQHHCHSLPWQYNTQSSDVLGAHVQKWFRPRFTKTHWVDRILGFLCAFLGFNPAKSSEYQRTLLVQRPIAEIRKTCLVFLIFCNGK